LRLACKQPLVPVGQATVRANHAAGGGFASGAIIEAGGGD